MFEDFGFGRPWSSRTGWSSPSAGTEGITWAPRIDVAQHDNQLVIRADLPGLSKDDIKVDATEDGITIQGERRREHEDERRGVYHRERSYGSFYRFLPLPPGAIADQAKASFKDGVLEISMPAPPEQVNRGRRLEIKS
jgi:HSP20 family protein